MDFLNRLCGDTSMKAELIPAHGLHGSLRDADIL
jgi:hypothetical protein